MSNYLFQSWMDSLDYTYSAHLPPNYGGNLLYQDRTYDSFDFIYNRICELYTDYIGPGDFEGETVWRESQGLCKVVSETPDPDPLFNTLNHYSAKITFKGAFVIYCLYLQKNNLL